MKYLISVINPISQDRLNELLYYAGGSGDLSMVKYLVEELGATFDRNSKRTALDEAKTALSECQSELGKIYNKHKKIVEYLEKI